MDQTSRIRELERFKAGEINILVASDVAARGLDIKGVSHVFNFDTPWHPDDYVHRIGRTGRAGAKGRAFTFVAEEDGEAISNVEKLTKSKIPVFGKDDVRVELKDGSSDDEDAKPRREEKRSRSKKRKDEPRETGSSRGKAEETAPREGFRAGAQARSSLAPTR